MAFFTIFAVYFVIWWMTLFAVLPMGLKTQEEEGEVVPGSVKSAPARFRMLRVLVLTTLISALIYGGWFLLTRFFGFSFDSIPQFYPDFDKK